MLSEVLDSFRSFTPKFLKTVVTEEYPIGYEPINAVNEEVKLQGVPALTADQVECEEH